MTCRFEHKQQTAADAPNPLNALTGACSTCQSHVVKHKRCGERNTWKALTLKMATLWATACMENQHALTGKMPKADYSPLAMDGSPLRGEPPDGIVLIVNAWEPIERACTRKAGSGGLGTGKPSHAHHEFTNSQPMKHLTVWTGEPSKLHNGKNWHSQLPSVGRQLPMLTSTIA